MWPHRLIVLPKPFAGDLTSIALYCRVQLGTATSLSSVSANFTGRETVAETAPIHEFGSAHHDLEAVGRSICACDDSRCARRELCGAAGVVAMATCGLRAGISGVRNSIADLF